MLIRSRRFDNCPKVQLFVLGITRASANMSARRLSCCEMQRSTLECLLVRPPPCVIFADAPTASLDKAYAQKAMQALSQPRSNTFGLEALMRQSKGQRLAPIHAKTHTSRSHKRTAPISKQLLRTLAVPAVSVIQTEDMTKIASISAAEPFDCGLLDGTDSTLPRRIKGRVVHLADHDFVISSSASKWTVEALHAPAKESCALSDPQHLNALRNYVFANLTAMRLYEVLAADGKQAFAGEVFRVVKK